MIPVKLRLRNFMCYRGDGLELDFSGLQLACLAGQNGHGKSALLDAITWGLWGKARATRANDLVSLGEEEMEIQFDFELGDNVYRVIRKRTLSGRSGRGALDFQVAHDDGFNSLSESSMRATQAKIDALLRMDYDTFINSAFLLQGRANEFTTKSPSERKRILGEILGLSIYDRYEERARDLAREAESKELTAKSRMQEMERELAHEAQYRQELEEAEETVRELRGVLDDLEETLGNLRQRKHTLDLQRKQHDELSRRLLRAEHELEEAQQQLAIQEEKRERLTGILNRRAEIEAGYESWQAAREAESNLGAKMSTLMALNRDRNQLEQEIGQRRTELLSRQRSLQERQKELAAKAARIEELQQAVAKVQTQLEELEAQEEQLEAYRQEMQELTAEKARLEAENRRLRQDMDEIKEKLSLLKEAEARCPLCGSELDDAHQEELLTDFQAEGTSRGDRYRANRERIAEIKQRQETLTKTGERLKRTLGKRAHVQRAHARLEQDVDEAQAAAKSQEAMAEELEAVATKLEKRAYAQEAVERLADLDGQIAELDYDQEAHEQARANVAKYAGFEEQHRELQMAAELVEDAISQIETLQKAEARWQNEVKQTEAQIAELSASLEAAQKVEKELVAAEAEQRKLREKESRAQLKLGAARQKLTHCDTLRVERTKLEDRLYELAEQKGAYQELRLAFGQRGLRAMIIESAIPEIEDEANRLLARMTENRMHVRFDTQRETLKGDPIETLDIHIADELGTRQYEMYSGGERFRVDFAIRVALSKLLARRSGAQLQTLVIDEGFGTQDAQGRERLVEAINSIADDFACILVITHIEELRDVFPVHIQVEKTPEGSRFAMV